MNATLHKYDRGHLDKALLAMLLEAGEAEKKGYELVGYQVVESERCVATMYRKVKRAPPTGASLIGE